MAGVFISYRRDDTQWPAGRIFDRLATRIDVRKIFMDVDGISPGVDFVEELGKRVGNCDALIALVGKSWASISDEKGRRRLDDPRDFVRIEIESALERDVRVIPVLIDGAQMPKPDDLPFAIKSFSRRHALEVSHTSFTSDLERLCETLLGILKIEGISSSAMPSYRRNGHAAEELGGYSHESVAWIEGRYLTLRPTFSPPGAIFAYCTEIKWDAGLCRLVFRELERSDEARAHSGFVSIPNRSGAIYLVTNKQGPVRTAIIGRPTNAGEMFGILTTMQEERGSRLTPATCPIAFIPEDRVSVPWTYGRISPGDPGFAYGAGVLDRILDEGYCNFFKPPRTVLRTDRRSKAQLPVASVRASRIDIAADAGTLVGS